MPFIDPAPEEQRKYQEARSMLRKLEKSGIFYIDYEGKATIRKPQPRWVDEW